MRSGCGAFRHPASVATIPGSLRRLAAVKQKMEQHGFSRHDSRELEAERSHALHQGCHAASVATIPGSLRRMSGRVCHAPVWLQSPRFQGA